MNEHRVLPAVLLTVAAAVAAACSAPLQRPAAAPAPTAAAPAADARPAAAVAARDPDGAASAPAPGPAASPGAADPPPGGTPRRALDPARVGAAIGGKPEVSDDVVRVTFPRDDVRVDVDGWKMPPFMGLTSWAGFVAAEKLGVEAMVMGDLVLFEDEVDGAMSAALDGGLEVTALHNHFLYDKPRVLFMHVGGEGTVEQLGKGVRAALDAARAVRQKAPRPAAQFGAPPRSAPGASQIDAAKLDAVLGIKGQAKDGMYKGTFGRRARAECGCTIGKAMGVSTWAAFAGSDDDAIVDGDFAVLESELQPVLKSLRASGTHVVAIHSHMASESPRLLFLHYWGRGRAVELAGAVKRALDLTGWDGRTQT